MFEDIMNFNEILDHIQNQNDKDQIDLHFKRVTSHEGPFYPNYPNFNGSLCDAMIEWENGESHQNPYK